MLDLFLQPVFDHSGNYFKAEDIHIHDLPEVSGTDLAVFGVEFSGSFEQNAGSEHGPDAIRKYLKFLAPNYGNLKIRDFGNIKAGSSIKDTFVAIREVVSFFRERQIPSFILGGSKEIMAAQYESFSEFSWKLQVTTIDSQIDLSPNSVYTKIITSEPNHLFNISVLGFQSYFVPNEVIEAFDKMYFDLIRLGVLRAGIEKCEPYIRDADIFSFDMSAIRYANAPGQLFPSPNGLTGEEACALMRYAGLSNGLKTAGIYEYNPDFDERGQTALLIAQMFWYYVEGLGIRRSEHPLKQQDDFIKYRTVIQNHQYEIVFYKSKFTDKWWMEIPNPRTNKENTLPICIPCSYEDYQIALKDEMPDRWWKAYQKFI